MAYKIESYDRDRLMDAYEIVYKTYGYYFGARGYAKIVKRLERIMKSLDELLTEMCVEDQHFATFDFFEIAIMTKDELEDAGIKTGSVFRSDGDRWYVPWMVSSKNKEQIARHIISKHTQ